MCVGDSPPLAGHSPSYLVRQIWDIQQGSRNNEEAQLMKLAIANLTPDDMIAIAAYVSSRKPVYSPLIRRSGHSNSLVLQTCSGGIMFKTPKA